MARFSFSGIQAELWLMPGIFFCLFAAPYTKVEESFNMQAAHDFLAYGMQSPVGTWLQEHYDHVQFPGAVPRTFVGAFVLSSITKSLSYVLGFFTSLASSSASSSSSSSSSSFTSAVPITGLPLQLLLRAVLGLWNAECLAIYSHALRRAFGSVTATKFIMFTFCQFHVLFYASRTLPNFLAFGAVTLALADLLPMPLDGTKMGDGRNLAGTWRLQRALVLLTVMGIVFRSEIAVLLACHTLALLWQGRLGLIQVILAGVIGLSVGLALTVPLDSLLWQRLVWPELDAFVFNVVQGRAEEWGTEPVYYYFLAALPKLLFNPVIYLVGLPVALFRDVSGRSRAIILPNLFYVTILSLQGHKEWRFVVYVLPPLTAVAAEGAVQLGRIQTKAKGVLQKVSLLVIPLSIALSVLAGYGFLIISSLNYPGAAALHRFHVISRASDTAGSVSVHMDTLTCMTGVTRFLEIPTPQTDRIHPSSTATGLKWLYDKEENEEKLLDATFWTDFDYVITESPERAIGPWKIVDELGTVTGFSGFTFTKSSSELQRQRFNAGLAGDPSSQLSDAGRQTLVLWNDLGLFVSKFTKERWLTIRMEPKLYILKHTRGAL